MDFLFIILFIAFLLTGIFSGFVAGLLGVGGGIIIVPITYFVLNYLGYSNDVIMHVAVASSLGIIVFTSISSILSHIKLNNVDYYVIKKWSAQTQNRRTFTCPTLHSGCNALDP